VGETAEGTAAGATIGLAEAEVDAAGSTGFIEVDAPAAGIAATAPVLGAAAAWGATAIRGSTEGWEAAAAGADA
jgi:hypothetical protein